MPATLLELPPLAFDLTPATAAPTFGVRGGKHRLIDFLFSADQDAHFTGVMPEARDTSDVTVTIGWVSDAVAGDAVFGAAFERHDQGVHDLDLNAFAAEKTVISTAPGTSGTMQYAAITFTSAETDAIVAGEQFRIRVRHLGTNGSRTIAANPQVTSVQIEQVTAGGGGGGGGFFDDGVGVNAAIGKGTTTPVAAGANAFAQGDQCEADGNNSFAQGFNNETNHIGSFAQGSGNSLTATNGAYSFAQGRNHIVRGYANFAQGNGCTTGDATAGGNNLFAQGAVTVNDQGGDNSFAQGSGLCRAEGGFAQGDGCNIYGGGGIFAQGWANYANIYGSGGSPYTGINGVFVQGYNNQFAASNADEIRGAFVQGTQCKVYSYQGQASGSGGLGTFVQGYGCYSWGRADFVQGDGSRSGSYTYNSYGNFAQGVYAEAYGGNSNFVQGYNVDAGFAGETIGTFVQGRNTRADGDYSFAQGVVCRADGARSFARGLAATSYRDDQTSWGSNRAFTPNRAQSAWINKHTFTTDATPTNILTFDLIQDYAYKLDVHIIARNTTTNGENSNFVTRDALAYRDTAGAAVLSGSPVALTEVQTGTDVISARILSSGNNILVEVTGDASDRYEWLVHFEFIEVRG